MLKIIEMRKLNNEELQEKYKSLREEVFNLRFQLSLGQIENSAKVKELKKVIARIKTVQRERELKGTQKLIAEPIVAKKVIQTVTKTNDINNTININNESDNKKINEVNIGG